MLRISCVFAVVLCAGGCATSHDAARPAMATTSSPANLAIPTPGVYSAGRLQPADLVWLRANGLRHVIDLTDDAETPDFDEAARVQALGVRYDNLPIRGAESLTLENIRTFDALLRVSDRPVLVHCSSSNRVGAVAALRAAWIDGVDAEAAIAEGKRWGLKGLEPAVREVLERGDVGD